MLILHFMTKDVFTLAPETTCEEAHREFRERSIRRAPVVDGDRIVGIVSEGDLLAHLPGSVGLASSEEGASQFDTPIERVMATDVKSVRPGDHLDVATQQMSRHKIGGLPVVEGEKLRGIVTESDVFRALTTALSYGVESRLILMDRPAAGEEFSDYTAACEKFGCRVQTLLHYPLEGGSVITYLGLAGGRPRKLMEELWKGRAQVVASAGID